MRSKNELDLVSVIVPVYNVETYLHKCVESILAQTYKNIEIILVDDGSTDSSGQICDLFTKKDDRIIVIHKANGGLSDARNIGVDSSKGDFITFIDSDDIVSKNYIYNLVTCIKKTDANLATTCAYKFYDDVSCVEDSFDEGLIEIFSSQNALQDMFYRKKIPVYAVAKIYRKELFDYVKFPVGEYFEDLSTEYLFFHYAKKIAFNPVKDYFYRQRRGSIINSAFDTRKMIQITTMKKIIKFVKCYYPQILNSARSKTFIIALNLYRTIPNEMKYQKEQTLLKNIIKQYRYSVLKDKNNKFLTRVIAAISVISIRIFKDIGVVYQFAIEKEIIKLRNPI